MRIMAKLATAFRGGVRESAEVIIDANSLRIFAQEIHECDIHIKKTKQQLASIIAEKKRVEREVASSESIIDQYEKRLAELIQQNDEVGALKLAKQISVKESLLHRSQKHYEKLQDHEDQMQQTLQTMVNRFDHFRSEYRMAKSTGKMQSAQSKLSGSSSGVVSNFVDMQDSLDRIREKQQEFSDEMTAMDQINAQLYGGTVDADVEQNISAKEILDRVKRKLKENED